MLTLKLCILVFIIVNLSQSFGPMSLLSSPMVRPNFGFPVVSPPKFIAPYPKIYDSIQSQRQA